MKEKCRDNLLDLGIIFKGGKMARKSGQNEGSVYQRKDGRWVAAVTIQEKRLFKYFKMKKDAKEWLKQTLAQTDAGLSIQGARYTLSEYSYEWLKAISGSLRPNTFSQYVQVFTQHINPSLGKMKLKDIRPEHIQALYNRKITSGAGVRTVLVIHGVLHHALRQALKTGLIIRNPADAVIRPRLVRKEMKTLNDTQIRNLLLASQGTRLETLLYVAVTTGLRMGEIIGLKWEDLDMTARTLQIRRQVQRQKGKGLLECELKTKSSRRLVVLGESTIEKLKSHFNEQQTQRQLIGDRWTEKGLIFPNTLGKPMEHNRLLKEFKEILSIAGLPIIRFHDLRHTAATLMFQMGINPKVVQEMLGHSDVNLTLNTYTHSLQSMQMEASNKMDLLVTMIEVQQMNKTISSN